MNALLVAPGVAIPLGEITARAITGGGPGGQHVNRSATRISLQWNVRTSQALDDEQRARVIGNLSSRIDNEGNLRIVAGEHRSQLQNRHMALERLRQLVRRALMVPRVRKTTQPSRSAVEKRLDHKRYRSRTKQLRRHDHDD